MKKIVFLFLLLGACANKERAVNDSDRYLLLPAPNATGEQRENERQQQMVQDWIGRQPKTAIAGHVYLDGSIPRPLSRVNVELSKNQDGQWKSVTNFDTEMDGSFKLTQLIYSGSYRLSSKDKRYQGEIFFDLNEPRENLVLTLRETKK